MPDIKLTIDDREVTVPEGATILDAANLLSIPIPTLCFMHDTPLQPRNNPAACRVCVVEVEGRRNLAPSCATPAAEGMVVRTHTMRVVNARRTMLELLISNHPKECLMCAQSGECRLQELADLFAIRRSPYEEGLKSDFPKDASHSIIRDMNKCIRCRRCVTVCNEGQTCGVLSAVHRGFDAVMAPAFDMNLLDSVCTNCGQCVMACPVGALVEHDHSWKVLNLLSNPGDKVIVVQTAPSVRAALGEAMGYPAGTSVTGKMVAALRRIGFKYVFDTDFAADLTIMEEAHEIVDRLTRYLAGDKTVKLPVLTSCCPGWVKFFEHHFADLLDVPSTAKSPQQMFGAIAKSYFAERLGVPRDKLVVISVMPCLAKKYEAARPEFSVDGNPDVDIVISTRELARLIGLMNINFADLPDDDFDAPLGESTGAGVIFGATGGVLEAALRTAAEAVTGKPLDDVDFNAVRGLDGIRTAEIPVGDLTLKVGIAYSLGNARKLLNRVRAGEPFHVIEVMACPGGCVGGGGQPYYHGSIKVIEKRAGVLYREDLGKPLRRSHDNPYIKELYGKYLDHPLSEKAHKLLHTHYFARPLE